MLRTTLVVGLVAFLALAVILGAVYIERGTRGLVNMLGVNAPVPSEIQDILERAGGPPLLKVSSPAFKLGERIPEKYTCDATDTSIPLRIEGIPLQAKSLVVIMYDPDAPRGVFYHWLLYSIETRGSSSIEIPEGIPKAPVTSIGLQGVNDFKKIGYGGPCPPPGKEHRYVVVVFALKESVSIEPGTSLSRLLDAIRNSVIAYGATMGVYSRR